jgi:hypothetical protein
MWRISILTAKDDVAARTLFGLDSAIWTCSPFM